MKIALCSDELYPIHDLCIQELERLGHKVISFGAPKTRVEENWVLVAREAALAIKNKSCDEGIFFCYTGTGISMAANKIPGIRAALCSDAKTARDARIWNDANVLALSNRLISFDILKEILISWFSNPDKSAGEISIKELQKIDDEFRK
jgi:ribose 5-phosphate isomerase B